MKEMFLLQAAFAATCMTIVSGATAERMDYAGYLITRCQRMMGILFLVKYSCETFASFFSLDLEK